MNSLYILDVNLLSVMWFANVFSCSVDCFFILLMVSIVVQKLLSSMSFPLFVFVSCAFCASSKIRTKTVSKINVQEAFFSPLVASLVAQRLKRLPPMRETWVWSLGQEDPLEKEMVTHSSIRAWRIPWMEKPGRLQSTGSQRVRHDWATSLFTRLSSGCHTVLWLRPYT